MTITLPDHIPSLRQMTECELKQKLAFSLYAARKIILVQLAGESRLLAGHVELWRVHSDSRMATAVA